MGCFRKIVILEATDMLVYCMRLIFVVGSLNLYRYF